MLAPVALDFTDPELTEAATRLLNAKEVAERLGVSERGGYNFMNSGAIAVIKVAASGKGGGQLRVREVDLAAWLMHKANVAAGLERSSAA
jgi:predicted site-specific integrase-resolvase